MPFAPKKPCKTPGCPGLVDAGLCAVCRAKGLGREDRPTTAQRGYGYRWQKFAKAYLRSNPLAVDIFNCFNGRIYPAEVVDHIVPHRGDPVLFWSITNLQGLRKVDHDRKTATEDGGFGRCTQHSTR
jgi:5-methylcytosine-specific restriction enzyme A